jgi:hypothetical protein
MRKPYLWLQDAFCIKHFSYHLSCHFYEFGLTDEGFRVPIGRDNVPFGDFF